MSILDKLIEKKDIDIYLSHRIANLKRERLRQLKTAPTREREFLSERFAGRIRELERLKGIVEQGKLKDAAKAEWNPED